MISERERRPNTYLTFIPYILL
ncbi:BgTH12-04787 [Blumeria graminis f. sp. triticale]|uniref:Bgt-51788 n=2 Tax=Blumeria graminis TaxID=34373 RepID=A0A9X9PQR4_BLUGR|nr:BgTH12-04787 [Blumeria graminis f. sp. triticale]VCU39251.1 Bgt-51788 [Blumeria graminis f. sp. tritici]